MTDFKQMNITVLKKLSYYLNNTPDAIDKQAISNIMSNGVSEVEAYALMLCGYMDIDAYGKDRAIFENYIKPMIKKLDQKKYYDNPYFKLIDFKEIKNKNWEFKYLIYKPYEMFVYDDFKYYEDGRVLAQLGYFDTEYRYPCVLQNNREWMLITPNEIETMQPVIDKAKGKVLTYGLGLGYFALMTSLKKEVEHVTVVEKDEEVIKLFTEHLLSQFPNANKIEIVNDDAFTYASKLDKDFDLTFVDLWHDPSDGIAVYEKFKTLEKGLTFYWIEDTMKFYIESYSY